MNPFEVNKMEIVWESAKETFLLLARGLMSFLKYLLAIVIVLGFIGGSIFLLAINHPIYGILVAGCFIFLLVFFDCVNDKIRSAELKAKSRRDNLISTVKAAYFENRNSYNRFKEYLPAKITKDELLYGIDYWIRESEKAIKGYDKENVNGRKVAKEMLATLKKYRTKIEKESDNEKSAD